MRRELDVRARWLRARAGPTTNPPRAAETSRSRPQEAVARRRLRRLEIAGRLDDLKVPPDNRLEAPSNFEPLPVDAAVAASYAELAAATHRAGRKATGRSLDLMIAAIAHAHGARLVTSNVADVAHLSAVVEIVEA